MSTGFTLVHYCVSRPLSSRSSPHLVGPARPSFPPGAAAAAAAFPSIPALSALLFIDASALPPLLPLSSPFRPRRRCSRSLSSSPFCVWLGFCWRRSSSSSVASMMLQRWTEWGAKTASQECISTFKGVSVLGQGCPTQVGQSTQSCRLRGQTPDPVFSFLHWKWRP